MKATPPLILPLDDHALVSQTPCGGKALGLSKLFSFGARVPHGVVVIGKAHEPETARELQTWIARNARADKLYAVRSSALCEDGPANSFAGIFDTFLKVPPHGLLDAVTRCQSSGYSARAAAYCAMRSAQLGSVAVVIQEMVEARAAGVCFSANPFDGDVTKVVIEVVTGLGESLVSGAVTPEYWMIGSDNDVLAFENGDDAPGATILRHADAQQIAAEARRLATDFGYPLDIEFALTSEAMYILQARPITATGAAA